ncbi:MAG: beta-galactosidase [Spirochaetes bacterium]|nr:beta-galactosidase [Spirochaetota bacterium]
MKKRLILFLFCLFVYGYLYSEEMRTNMKDNVNSPYGVLAFFAWDHEWNHNHYNEEKIKKAVSLMKEAGIDWIRMDFLWGDVEPKRGVFNFEKYDRIVNIVRASNIHILGILEYNPEWRKDKWNAAPWKDLYIIYASKVVQHFKDRVKHWEVWNEPDDTTYWEPQDNMKTYSELLKDTYTVLKIIDPDCKIAMGGVAKTIVLSLKNIYKNIGKDYFDIVNIHPFINPLVKERMVYLNGIYKGVRQMMKRFKDAHKEIWFTEIGSPGVKEPDPSNGWWHGLSPTEEEQARWVKEVYTNALKWKGVTKIFWAFFRDAQGHWNNGVDYFGLVTTDFKKKPAFDAYKEVTKRKK